MRLLIGPWPDRKILYFQYLPSCVDVFSRGTQDHRERLIETRAQLRHRHVIDLVFARHPAREARHHAAARNAVRDRKLLGDAQRMCSGTVAEDEELEPPRALRAGHAIMSGEFISPCGVVWCSFRPTPS